jgi:hypothetical protein
LRSRHTWATTGDRLVARLWSDAHIQGDEFTATNPVTIHYQLLGTTGWDKIVAYTHAGLLWQRNLHAEAGYAPNRIRLRWGGARIKDRYRSAQWRGRLDYRHIQVQSYHAYGLEHGEEYVRRAGALALEFQTDTFGDADAIVLQLSDLAHAQFDLHLQIDSYTKVGNPLQRNPYIHCPEFHWEFSGQQLLEAGILRQELGGTELFVAAERLTAEPLPREITGNFTLSPQPTPFGFLPVYLTAYQLDNAQVWTSPLFITWV